MYDYELELRENGKHYFRLTNSTLPYQVGGFFIHLDNLFNGDKLLGKSNWTSYTEEIILQTSKYFIEFELVKNGLWMRILRNEAKLSEVNSTKSHFLLICTSYVYFFTAQDWCEVFWVVA